MIGHEKIWEELDYGTTKLYIREFVTEFVKFTEGGNDESWDVELADYEKYSNAVKVYRHEENFKAKGEILSMTMVN